MVSGGNEVVRIMRQRSRNPDASCQPSVLLLYKHPDATLEQFSEDKHPNDCAECRGLRRHAANSTFKEPRRPALGGAKRDGVTSSTTT